MARLKRNFLGGTLDEEMDFGDDELESIGFAAIPEISLSSDDYLPIIVDPDGDYGSPVIMYVIGHSAYSNIVTVDNTGVDGVAKEGTTATAYMAGTEWVHGPTVVDFSCRNEIDLPKKTPDALDQDWIDPYSASWVIEGVEAEVSLTSWSGGYDGYYDLSSEPGTLLGQVSNNSLAMRRPIPGQFYSNDSVVAAVSLSQLADSATAWSSDDIICRFGISAYESFSNYHTFLEVKPGNDTIKVKYVGASILGGDDLILGETPEYSGMRLLGERLYLRIVAGDAPGLYYGFYSGDGETWVPMGTHYAYFPMNYIRLEFVSANNVPVPVPIQRCHWIRRGGPGIKPW